MNILSVDRALIFFDSDVRLQSGTLT